MLKTMDVRSCENSGLEQLFLLPILNSFGAGTLLVSLLNKPLQRSFPGVKSLQKRKAREVREGTERPEGAGV